MAERQGMSEAQYARHVGISQPAVNQAKRAGRIVMFPDGSIDQVASDQRYFGETDLAQSARGKGNAGPRGASGAGAAASQFAQVKALHEIARTQMVREKLARMRGEVISRREAERIVFALARSERDTWLQWPTRVAAAIAAELGPEGRALDIHTVQLCLERHVAAHLAEMPPPDPHPFPASPELGLGDDEEEG